MNRSRTLTTALTAVTLAAGTGTAFAHAARDSRPHPPSRPRVAGSAASRHPGLPAGRWRLAFGDEFNGHGLNTRKWATRYPWGDQFNSGNSEAQCYVRNALREGRGTLTITAARRQTTCRGGGSQVSKPYSSGMIQSARAYTFTHGYAEIRAKLPGNASTWPAFWLLPSSLGWPPELDVFEGWGQSANHGLDRITQTFIWKNSGGSASNAQTQLTGRNFSRWHTYGVDWEANRLTFYVDGVARASYASNIPSQPMYLLANLAMMGSAGSDGPAKAQMKIDWVRVYKHA